MSLKEQLHSIIEAYQQNELLEAYDPGHWRYLLRNHDYVDLEAVNATALVEKAEESGYFLSEPVSEAYFQTYQKRCKFEIPAVLQSVWMQANGFLFTKRAKDLFMMPIRFGILPMQAAFGGEREVSREGKLLQFPILEPELFKDNLEFGFVKKGKVALKGILSNCILLELFSEDLLRYTLYKMDHASKEKYSQLYITLEHGPYPLSLSLEEYIEAMLVFQGLVFAWPTMFILEDNVDPSVLDDKYRMIETAKQNSQALDLNIDFEKYGL